MINQILQNMLEVQLHTLDYNFDQFNDSKKLIDNLNKNLKEIEGIRKDPENFISEYFSCNCFSCYNYFWIYVKFQT